MAVVVESGVVLNHGGDELVDLPPGFRFHPTDEEIISSYLKEKVLDSRFTAVAMGEADLNKCEPWDLPSKFYSIKISITKTQNSKFICSLTISSVFTHKTHKVSFLIKITNS